MFNGVNLLINRPPEIYRDSEIVKLRVGVSYKDEVEVITLDVYDYVQLVD